MIQGDTINNEELRKYTTWRVGGPAKQLFKPANIDDLILFLRDVPESEPLLWIGLGSNTLVRDGGFDGTVILTQGCLNDLSVPAEGLVRAEAGVSCATMARFCARNHLLSAEFWAGIPGTMGGALRMNAGCFDGETWNNVVSVETIDRHGVIRTRRPEEFQISYRSVVGLSEDEWFVSGTFQLSAGNKSESLASIKQLLARRADTQPTGEFNCGSVFRNPDDRFAAQLIESCGLKGFCIGDARVSEKHANFIINGGEATASDIEDVIDTISRTVSEQRNIDLKREVHIIGQRK